MNIKIKKIIAIKGLIFVSIILISAIVGNLYAESTKIYTASGKYQDYYHVKFMLTPENTLLALKGYDKYGPSIYEFSDGLFQVFIPKDKFPIPAPNSKGYIILRMPMTITDNPKKDEWIAEKKVLFDKIKEMKESGKGSVEVVVELSSDVKIMNKDPLVLELEGANVFFRNAHGKYIDYVGALKD